MKHSGLVVWAFICVAVAAMVVFAVGHTRQYNGNDITVTTGSSDLIEVTAREAVNLEAASGSLFMLTGPNGETLVGNPEKSRPLGWNGDKYIVLKTTQISSGKWVVEEGSALTLHFTANGSLTIEKGLKGGSLFLLILGFAAATFAVWLLGYAVMEG